MKLATEASPGRTALGHACGKLILIGEHAVVYGQPAIATPVVQLGVQATVERTDGPLSIDCSLYSGDIAAAPDTMKGLVVSILETLKRLGSPAKGLLIRLASSIPPGRGLGSSAAVAAAAVRGLVAYHGRDLEQSELMSLTHIAEVYAHGTPSGIDTAAVFAKHPLWFRKGEPVESVPVHHPFHLVIADSGRLRDTHSAVASVRDKLKAAPERIQARLEHIGELARQARKALFSGDAVALGATFSGAQEELEALGVSDDILNVLIAACMKAGALGAKLTGSGRGGCIFALARDAIHSEQIAAALTKAGAHAAWRCTLGEEGAR